MTITMYDEVNKCVASEIHSNNITNDMLWTTTLTNVETHLPGLKSMHVVILSSNNIDQNILDLLEKV